MFFNNLGNGDSPLTSSLLIQKLALNLKLLYGIGTQCTWRQNIRCVRETMKCVLWHESAKSHESEDKEDGGSKVCHEQLVAKETLQRGEKCIPRLRRTRPF